MNFILDMRKAIVCTQNQFKLWKCNDTAADHFNVGIAQIATQLQHMVQLNTHMHMHQRKQVHTSQTGKMVYK